MRTTIDLEDDVLNAIKQLSKQQKKSMGKVVSDLLRESLSSSHNFKMRNGIPLLPHKEGGKLVTIDIVNQLRDEEL